MKTIQEKMVEITSLSHDGRGIAIVDGKTTFVAGALRQEKVRCKITKKHTNYEEAEVIEVLQSSSERATPQCEHFTICGGCTLQHMTDTTQLQLKQNTLLDQLKHFGKVIPETVIPPLSGKPWGYRRKARLGVRFVRKKGKLLVGFREKSSHFLADIQSCSILHPKIGLNIQTLSNLIASLERYEAIPQIEVAVGDEEAALVFRHLEDFSAEDIEKLQRFGEEQNIHIYLQPNPPAAIHKIWPEDQKENLKYAFPYFQLEFSFHPLDFVQINGELNKLIVQQAIELLELNSNDDVLDLFCGLGNFTLPIARFAKSVTGVEGSKIMTTRATENANHNALSNVSFYTANLFEPDITAAWMQKKYHKILLDPPRTGAKEIMPFLKNFAAKRIVYISCNPATLARDAGELVQNQGYKLKKTGIINMFPHTTHIEAIAVFEK